MKSLQNASGLHLMHQAICKSNQGIHSASFACKIFQITAMIIIPQSLGDSLISLSHKTFFMIQPLSDYLWKKSLLQNRIQTGETGG